ncbi:hypothetical protein RHRU231_540032 [Rhodococcus ruber]|uniref:Transposase n=1 Tax=Rhodococcus ruber TaxID=1830 RepID=A0A098BN88_9NOCA|nr:hypothetical protein RHRU231_540032 [Rhodococcus ruber]
MAQQFAGSSWQWCRVHFMRNIRAAVATMWLLPEVHRGVMRHRGVGRGRRAAANAVQVGAGIEPPERRGSGVVTLREPRQAVFGCPEIGEVIGSKNLPLHHGEVDFDLIEPRRMHRVWTVTAFGYRCANRSTAVRGTVVDNPEHAPGRRVRLACHDLIDPSGERLDTGGGLAPAEHRRPAH